MLFLQVDINEKNPYTRFCCRGHQDWGGRNPTVSTFVLPLLLVRGQPESITVSTHGTRAPSGPNSSSTHVCPCMGRVSEFRPQKGNQTCQHACGLAASPSMRWFQASSCCMRGWPASQDCIGDLTVSTLPKARWHCVGQCMTTERNSFTMVVCKCAKQGGAERVQFIRAGPAWRLPRFRVCNQIATRQARGSRKKRCLAKGKHCTRAAEGIMIRPRPNPETCS
jgi:hypothetical protein